jgi:hypothetical protein
MHSPYPNPLVILDSKDRAMQIRSFPRIALFLLISASPALLRAQFQEPTQDELKMTADPKAPGAAAVYLNIEDITDDKRHIHDYYQRIKVLAEKGKELATVRIPYLHSIDAGSQILGDTVGDIQGRTIHADGAVVPLTAKPADLMDIKSKDYQVNTVVFTLPAVEVGSILEFRLRINFPEHRISNPIWNIQQPYFVHKAYYAFYQWFQEGLNDRDYVTNGQGLVLDKLLYSYRLPNDKKLNNDMARKRITLDLADIPAIPEEDWTPPINTLKWHVYFYYSNDANETVFWQDAGKHWAKEVNEFTNPSAAIKTAAAAIVGSAATDEEKARKIYLAVQKLDNTGFSRKKSMAERKKENLKQIRKAEDVWKQQSGSADEIALLYIALARAAGLKVWPMQVVDRNRAIFDIHYLDTGQLDDYLAVVVLGGKDVYLDPGQKMCPFGILHWKHTQASGFRLTDRGTVPDTTPLAGYQDSSLQRVAELFIDTGGSVKGTARFIMSGQDALHWRQLSLENDQDEVKKQFNESIRDTLPEGVQADFDHFLALDDENANLMAIVLIGGNIGAATGKRVFLPGLFFESRAKHPFVAQDKREYPVDVHYAKMEQDDVTYRLPPGLTVESAPPPSSTAWPNRAQVNIDSHAAADYFEVSRNFAYNFTLLDPKYYPDLHDFYRKLAAADQQQIVLTRSAAARGN